MEVSAANARVTAASGAVLVGSSPFVEVTQGEDAGEGFTVYQARALGSAVRRRALPQATGRCPGKQVQCPDLKGELSCTDVETDIFSKCRTGLFGDEGRTSL